MQTIKVLLLLMGFICFCLVGKTFWMIGVGAILFTIAIIIDEKQKDDTINQ